MSSTSSLAARVGAQRPTHLLTPDGDFDFSDGDDAVALADALGLHLFDWQKWLVRWILAVDEDGRPACNTVILVVPRQNGKGAILEAVELYWLIVAGVKVVIHTAHETDTAAGHQERLDALIGEPDIDLPNLRSYKANGKERIRNLDEKLVLQFRTRTKATKRGASPQKVVIDEMQEAQKSHISALVPAMAAQSMDPDKLPQLIYSGSAPLVHSHYAHELIDRVQAQRPPRTLLAMWACTADDDPDDVENWYRSNPSLGLLISEAWVRDTEWLVMDPIDFAAERLGVPQGGADQHDGPMDPIRWGQLIDGESMATDDTVRLGLDAPLDRKSACFSIIGKRPDNLDHVAIRFWLPPHDMGRLVEVAKQLTEEHGVRLALPPKSPALAWRQKLDEAGVDYEVVKAGDFAEAQAAIEQAVADGSLRHRGQPELLTAVKGLAARTSGDTSPWSRRSSSSNVAPLMAAAAAWALEPADPTPEIFAY